MRRSKMMKIFRKKLKTRFMDPILRPYIISVRPNSSKLHHSHHHIRKLHYTWRVESFAGSNFRVDKLSRTPGAKIKFRGYKLSRTWQILVKFSYFHPILSNFSGNILRTPMKVRFRVYKLSRVAKKLAKSRNFLPALENLRLPRKWERQERQFWKFLIPPWSV